MEQEVKLFHIAKPLQQLHQVIPVGEKESRQLTAGISIPISIQCNFYLAKISHGNSSIAKHTPQYFIDGPCEDLQLTPFANLRSVNLSRAANENDSFLSLRHLFSGGASWCGNAATVNLSLRQCRGYSSRTMRE